MKYSVLIKDAAGEVKLSRPIQNGEIIAIDPGDEVAILDKDGNPAAADYNQDGSDLYVEFPEGLSVTFEDYFLSGDDPEPVSIETSAQVPEEGADFHGIVKDAEGEVKETKPLTDGETLSVGPGDEVSVVDALGRPAGAELNQVGNDLTLGLPDGNTATVEDFFGQAGEGEPINVNLLASDGGSGGGTGTGEILPGGETSGSFSGQVGNLPQGGDFTLMRLSNLGYTTFDNDFTPPINQSPTGGFQGGQDPLPPIQQPQLEAPNESRPTQQAPPARQPGPAPAPTGGSSDSTPPLPQEPVNRPPTANDDMVTAGPGTNTIDLLENDSDPDGNPLRIIEIEGQPVTPGVPIELENGATVVVNDDGTVEYTATEVAVELDEGESITDTFEYTIADPSGATDTATANLTIMGVDDPIITEADASTVNIGETTTIDVIQNDSDIDTTDNPLVLHSVENPPKGTVSIDGNNVTFDPGSDFTDLPAGETEDVTFTYVVENADGATAVETVTITVVGENDGPTANDDAAETGQNVIVNMDLVNGDAGGSVADTDPDRGDVLNIVQIEGQDAAGGTITLPSGALVSLNPDGTVNYDPNGQFDALDEGETGTDTFEYTISDGKGGFATATATVTIQGTDEALVANDDTGSTDVGNLAVIDVLGNDFDPDTTDNPLTIQTVQDPPKGTAEIVNGNVVFDPGEDFTHLGVGETESVTFEYVVENQDGATEVASISVTVTGGNDGPIAAPDSAETTEDAAVTTGNVLENDSDPDQNDVLSVLSFDASGTQGVVTNNGDGTFGYDPNGQFNHLDEGETAIETFTYTATDGNGGTVTETVTVTIHGQDDAMITQADSGSVAVGQTVGVDVLANDSDPDTTDNPLTVSAFDQPDRGNVTQQGNHLVFDPGDDFTELGVGETTTVTFNYTAQNQDGETLVEQVTITVTGGNDGPIATPDAASTTEDSPVTTVNVLDNDSDPDANDVLSVIDFDTTGTVGTVTNNGDGTFGYDPAGNYNHLDDGETAIDTFTYTASDGNGGTVTETVTVTIHGQDDAMFTEADSGQTTVGQPTTIDVLANDGDPDDSDNPLAIDSFEQPPKGQVTEVNGQLVFDPAGDFTHLGEGDCEDVTFTYTAINQDGETLVETVTITVHGSNDGPIADPDFASTSEDAPVTTVNVLDNDSDPDQNDVLSVQSFDASQTQGIVTDNGDGTFGYDPNGQFNYLDEGETATDTFTYTATDGNGGTVTETVTVTIHGKDDAMATQADSGSTTVGQTTTVDVLANDSDPDTNDNPLIVSAFDQPDRGTVTQQGDQLVFDPAGDFEDLGVGETTTVTFNYTAQNADGEEMVEQVTITVTGTNDGPMALPDAASTTEDSPVTTVNVLNNDSDPDANDVLSVIDFDTTGTVGTVTINGDGTFGYDPAGNYDHLDDGETAVDTFTYTASDGNGGTVTETVTVTIHGQDDAMITQADSGATTVGQTTTVDVLANDSDPDTTDNPLTVSAFDQPDRGNVTQNGNQLVFDPGNDFPELGAGESTTVTFNYTAQNADGEEMVENVTITVTGTNDGPVALPDEASTTEDSPVTTVNVLNNDSDPDANDVLSVIDFDTTGTVGTVTNNGDGTFGYDPAGNYDHLDDGETAVDTFTYTASDGNGGTVTETVTVTIHGQDDAMITQADSGATTVGQTTTVDVLANDSDPDTTDNPLTVTAFDQPDRGSVTQQGNQLVFDPGSDFPELGVGETTTVTFNYTAQNADGEEMIEQVTITVTGGNDGPVAAPDAASTTEDSPVTTVNVLNNDSDPDANDTLSVQSFDASGTQGIVTSNGDGTFNYDPNGQFDYLDEGETAVETFTYTATDNHGATVTETVTVTIHGQDDAMQTQEDAGATQVGQTVGVDVLANDSDPDTTDNPLTVAGFSQPDRGSVTQNGNQLVFDPGNDFPELGAGESTTVNFTYTAQNADGEQMVENVTITVTGTNDGPVALPDAASTTEDSPVTTVNVLANDSDPDANDVLNVIDFDTTGTQGTVTSNGDGTFNYDPNGQYDYLDEGETAVDTFTYTASDGNGGEVTETVTVTIHGQDDAMMTEEDFGQVAVGQTVGVDVLANDSDPDTTDNPLTIASFEQPPKGSVSEVNGQLVFDPGADFTHLGGGETEDVTFTYVAQSADGETLTETVTITVTGQNDAPEADPDFASTDESTAITTGNVLANDSDPDGDELTITGFDTTGTVGTVTNNGDGTFGYDPNGQYDHLNPGETATDTFTYTASDGNGGTVTETVTVTIHGQNEGPNAVDDANAINEGAPPVQGNVLTNDSDPDGGQISVTSIEGAAPGAVIQGDYGTLTVQEDGSYTYNLNSDHADVNALGVGDTLPESFNYTISDGNGGTASATLNITINGTNDGPQAAPDFGATNEDTPFTTVNVLNNDSDQDANDSLTIVDFDTTGTVGTVTYNGDGTFNYDPAGNYNHLNNGESATTTFTYTVQDEQGAQVTETVTIRIDGQDDSMVTNPDQVTILPNDQSILTGNWGTGIVGGLVGVVAGAVETGLSTTGNIYNVSGDQMNNINAFSDSDVQGNPSLQFTFSGDGTGTITFTFDQPTTNPVLHVDRLGGHSNYISNSAQLTLLNDDASLMRLTGPDHFEVDSVSGTINRTVGEDTNGFQSSMNSASGTAAGSVMVVGTVTQVTFSIQMIGNIGSGDAIEMAWTVNQTDHSPQSVNVLGNDYDPDTSDNPLTVTGITQPALGTASFDANGNVTFDPGDDFTHLGDDEFQTVDITYTVQNADGETAQEIVSFTVVGSDGAPELGPIVFDMDGDGLEFVDSQNGISFDVDNDGVNESVAWAGNDDAVLIFDHDNDGLVTDRSEFAFTDYSETAQTDLEGLRAFDTDNDGLFSAGDQDFGRFKLWQDADGDGQVGEGEMFTLEEAGVESLNLYSDGIEFADANGDVYIHGTTEVNYTDGSTGQAGDATFTYEENGGGVEEVQLDQLIEPEGSESQLEVITAEGESLNLDEAIQPEIATCEGVPEMVVCEMERPEELQVEATPPAEAPVDDASAQAAAVAM